MKKNNLIVLIVLVILAGASIAYFGFIKPGKENKADYDEKKEADNAGDEIQWLVDTEGFLYYPQDREPVKFNRADHSQTEELSVSKIIYQSREENIYGFLVIPKDISQQIPGVILLPGAGVSKESELMLAENISSLGIAVLTLDQRGTGETGGDFPNLDEDFNNFVNAKEPYQHLMVYDALRAFDLLKSAPFINGENIIFIGESLGGRIATIATALDKDVKGLMVISSAGLNFEPKGDRKKDAFLLSIDSDHYIGDITPRKIFFMHNVNDGNIPVSSAINSYGKAKDPKMIFLINDTHCNHGYCSSMHDGLVKGLNFLLS